LVGRRGKKKALVAVGHKIIVAAYFIILNKKAYKEPELHDKPKKRKKQTKNYLNRINQLGISDEQLKALLNNAYKVGFLLSSNKHLEYEID